MGHFTLTDAGLWIDEFDLSGDHNAVALEGVKLMSDNTTFGLANMSNVPGRTATRFGHAGYWSSVADSTYYTRLGVRNAVMSLAAEKVEGAAAYLSRVVTADYTPEGSIDETFRFSVAGEVDDITVRGYLANLIEAGGSNTCPAIQIGELAAGETMYVAIHISAITASDVDISVRSDDNSGMTSAATQLSSLNHSAVTVVWDTSIVGPIVNDDWWDVVVTVTGGTVTLAVLLGIN
jgi:hypothetical protein